MAHTAGRSSDAASFEGTDGVVVDVLRDADAWAALPNAEALAERAARAALAEIADEVPPGAEMSVTLTDDARIRVLNRDWRGKDTATNVLSFPAPDLPEGADENPLGDVIVAFETVEREARADGKTLADHFTHLIVHGTLHLMGFDHEDEDEAQEMEDTERRVLASLGISDPYALPAAS